MVVRTENPIRTDKSKDRLTSGAAREGPRFLSSSQHSLCTGATLGPALSVAARRLSHPGEAQAMSFLSQHLCDSGYLDMDHSPTPQAATAWGRVEGWHGLPPRSSPGTSGGTEWRVECSD